MESVIKSVLIQPHTNEREFIRGQGTYPLARTFPVCAFRASDFTRLSSSAASLETFSGLFDA